MIKKLLFSILVLTTSWVYSQNSLQFIHEGKTLENNAQITVTKFTNDELGIEMKFKATIKNISNKDVNLIVEKEVIEAPTGTNNSFCTAFGCYPNGTSKSKKYWIKANEEDNIFYATFSPIKASKAIIKYTAKVVDTNDAVSVVVTYQYTPAGIEQVGFEALNITQQNGLLQIDYQINEDIQLEIIDLVGRVKGHYQLSRKTNTRTIHLNNNQGVFLLVFSNKQRKSIKKVIIQ